MAPGISASKRPRWDAVIYPAVAFISIMGLLLLYFIILHTGDEYISAWFSIAFSGLSVAGLLSTIGLYKNQELSRWGISSLALILLAFEAGFLFTSLIDTNDLPDPGLLAVWVGILLGLLVVSPTLAFVGLGQDKNKIFSILSLIFLVSIVVAYSIQ
jgi:hypothetical protein